MNDHDTIVRLQEKNSELERRLASIEADLNELNNLRQRGNGIWWVLTIALGLIGAGVLTNIVRFFNHILKHE